MKSNFRHSFFYRLFFLYIPYVYKRFESHNGWVLTSALAYFVILSFIPISLIALTFISYILPSKEALPFYLSNVRHLIPSYIDVNEVFGNIVSVIKSKRYLGFIAVPVLFWLASLIFDVIEETLELAFELEHKRPFWKSKLFHFLLLIIIGFIMFLLAIFSTVLAMVSKSNVALYIKTKLYNLEFIYILLDPMAKIINILFSLFIAIGIFYFIFRLVPAKRIKDISILKGAIFSGIAFEIAKYIFSFYVGNINNFRWLFGQIATFAIILVWSFYASLVFVVGAEVCFLFQKFQRRKRYSKKSK